MAASTAEFEGGRPGRPSLVKHGPASLNRPSDLADRIQGRLDRLDLSAEDASRVAGWPPAFLGQVMAGDVAMPRGKRLAKLAEILTTSVSYLIGLDPDVAVPDEYLADDQGELGLLAADEDTLLRAYRRLDMSSRAALLQVTLKMAPEAEADERKPRQLAGR